MKLRLLLFALLVVTAATLWLIFRDRLTLTYLAERQEQLLTFEREAPLLVYGAAFVLYAIWTGLSIPGALVLSLVFGWLFGFWRGVVLVSFGSTLGGTLAFLVSRYVFRDAIQARFGERLARFNEALAREGALYLLTLRLVFIVPFVVVNLVMGLTPIRVWTFWWVSQLGMLPATCIYVYAASTVPDLNHLAEKGVTEIFSLELVGALAVLGVFPLAIKWIVGRFKPPDASSGTAPGSR
jgi:uncharacterized membrane protein YdjX (TVP38/TMEM64 family)